MKKMLLGMLLSICVENMFAKKQTFNGATTLEDITLESITVNGSFKGKNLVITEKSTINGSATCKKSTVEVLKVSGACKIKDCEIKEIGVSGALNAKNSKIYHQCSVSGAVECTQMNIQGNMVVHGACEIKDSTIENLEWKGREAVLEDVTVTNIHVKGNADTGKQLLELKGKTVVIGTITLDDAARCLEIDDDVEIKGSIVRAGKVMTKDAVAEEGKNYFQKNDSSSEGLFCRVKKWIKKQLFWLF
jgi:cytoskeletal protein CcmA (bactofilin family)